MSVLEDKVAVWALEGVPTQTGGPVKGKRVSRIIPTKLEDENFERVVLERLEWEGFIETPEDLDELTPEVQKLVKEQRVISGIEEE